MKDENNPWFSTVKILKCYDGRDLSDKGLTLQTFFTLFPHCDTFKGVSNEYFFPLEHFQKVGKHINNLWWTIPENAELRKTFYDFMAWNKATTVRFHGGFCDKADVDRPHLEEVEHLIFKDAPSLGVKSILVALPKHLRTFSCYDLEALDKENFKPVMDQLANQETGLETFWAAWLSFDMEAEHRDLIKNVLKKHHKTLTNVSFARNRLTNEFIESICSCIAGDNRIEKFNLSRLVEPKDIDWTKIFKDINSLTKVQSQTIEITLNASALYCQQTSVHEYLETE